MIGGNISATYNFTIQQNATFATSIVIKDSSGNIRDLSSYTVRMQARFRHKGGSLVFTLKENDGIEIDMNNNINITISADRTNNLKDDTFYDIIIINNDNGFIERILEGQLIVDEGVTR